MALKMTGAPSFDGFGDVETVTVVCASRKCGRAARISKIWEKLASLRVVIILSHGPFCWRWQTPYLKTTRRQFRLSGIEYHRAPESGGVQIGRASCRGR